LLAQLITGPLGILIAALSSRSNVEFEAGQLGAISGVGAIAMLIRDIGLLTAVYLTNRDAIRLLSQWAMGHPIQADDAVELNAWKQITSLSWRYIFTALASLVVVAIGPVAAYMSLVQQLPFEKIVYVILASLAAGIGLAVLEILIIDALLSPARQVLLPRSFEAQVGGIKGLRILPRVLIVIFGLVTVGILLVAPAGYHQTVTAIAGQVDPAKAIVNLRLQLIVTSLSALVLGLLLAYSMADSLSAPIRHIISVLFKAEAGDLAQRIRTIPSDEIGELALHFNRMIGSLERLQTNLEEQVQTRTQQLDVTIEVGRVANRIMDIDELSASIANLFTDRFGYYFCAVYLIDPSGRWAELRSATGVAGQALKERGHKLELGARSVINSALSSREAVIALDVGPEAIRFHEPLLPETRSEIVLPLTAGERLIGALDIHSTQEARFGPSDAAALKAAADQVAVALENAQRFQELERNLAELRVTQRMYLSEVWGEAAGEHAAYEYLSGAEAPAEGEAAAIDVPLTLREQIIGKLSLESQQDWTADERTLIEAVATQAALALENARLLDESRQMALRERLAAEITGKIWSSPNIEFILQTSIKELGRALRADEATIELKMDEQ
jgi:GAF domain-containing protein